MPPRLIGLYALATMEREGVLHGYLLSERIAERTEGAWRPGAGAVYPSLAALVERKWARRTGVGRRREYRITPAGRAALRKIRRRAGRGERGGPDLSTLWSEILGVNDLGRFLIRRLDRSVEGVARYVARSPAPADAAAVRRAAVATLRRGRSRLTARAPARPRRGKR